MKTNATVHPGSPAPREEALSAWWDGELDTAQGHELVDELLVSEEDRGVLVRYSLIGTTLRDEPLDTRDLVSAVHARLQAEPAPGGGHGSGRSDNVVSLQQARGRFTGWSGAIAASVVAALVGVGVWVMQPAEQGALSPEGYSAQIDRNQTAAQAPYMAAAPGNASASRGASGGLQNVSDESQPMPSWARPGGHSRLDPYLMTHYESTSPQLGDVMPSARLTSFDSE